MREGWDRLDELFDELEQFAGTVFLWIAIVGALMVILTTLYTMLY